MSIQSINRIAEVSFKNHFLRTGEEKPVSGKIQVNHNTFDVTFANGRVRAKFASGNAFSNMFRSRPLSRFTERLQTQYNVWLDQQRQIEEAKAAEFALTLGFEDNPNTGKVKALVDEFKAFLEETNLAELAKLVKAQFSYETDLPDEEFQQKIRMPGMVVDYSAGARKGVFGFFMGKAKGMTPHAIRQDAFPSSPDAGLTPKQIRRLPDPQRRQVRADLQRELNRLQWLDLVTGQSDRHWENYFIHVDPATRKVTVTGIDNDAGYSQYRVGAAKFSFDKTRAELFRFRLKLLAQQIDPRHAKEVLARMLKDPGLSDNGEGGLDVDASKIGDKIIIQALKETTGIQGLALPDKIDRETYDALVAFKSGPARETCLDKLFS